MKEINNSSPTSLPLLRGKFYLNLFSIISDMNVVLKRMCVESLTELKHLCYCAARAVIEECGIQIHDSVTHKRPGRSVYM